MAKVVLYRKLRGKIREVFDTLEAFAVALGISKAALNQRLQGNVDWKMCEVVKGCELLGIPITESHLYFSLESFENKTIEELIC